MTKYARLSELFLQKHFVLSFEVFPPKTPQGVESLMTHLDLLAPYKPDFISVTYGAGGGTQETSLELLEKIQKKFNSIVLAHFTCVGATREGIETFLARLKTLGISNVLALRGDPPKDRPDFDFSSGVFDHASELVGFLRKTAPHLCLAVAGYPEGHICADSKESDWNRLKQKIEAGADAVITQLFLDNADYYAMRDGMKRRGVNIPIIPGILPVPSTSSFHRMVEMSRCKIPASFMAILEKYEGDPVSFAQATADYSSAQADDLIRNEVPGIHFYGLNRSEMVKKVLDTIKRPS